jgi:hypothetical protein
VTSATASPKASTLSSTIEVSRRTLRARERQERREAALQVWLPFGVFAAALLAGATGAAAAYGHPTTIAVVVATTCLAIAATAVSLAKVLARGPDRRTMEGSARYADPSGVDPAGG